MTVRSGSLFNRALTWGVLEGGFEGEPHTVYCFMDFDHRGIMSKGTPSLSRWFRMAATLIYYSIIGKKS